MPPGFNPVPHPPIGSPAIVSKLLFAKAEGTTVTLLVSGQVLRHVTIVDYSTVEVGVGAGRTHRKYDSFEVALEESNPWESPGGTIATDSIAAVFDE